MATIVPTIENIRWGPERWHLFDYWAHPTRDVGGNPCLIWRHGGGGTGGYYKDLWVDVSGAATPFIALYNYLNSASRAKHFDIISLESAQVGHVIGVGGSSGNLPFPRSKKAWIFDQLADFNRGIAAVKAWGLGGPSQRIAFTVAGWTEGSLTLTITTPANALAGIVTGASSPLIGALVTITSGTNTVPGRYRIITHTSSSVVTLSSSLQSGGAASAIVGYITVYGTSTIINPNKIVVGGQSHGATLSGLSQIRPPLNHGATQYTGLNRMYESLNFDSTSKGVLYIEGQIDCRRKDFGDGGGVKEYMAYGIFAGWHGTSGTDGGVMWNGVPNNVRDALSLRAYIERGETGYYVPHFLSYQTTSPGNGAITLSNAHDAIQKVHLAAALRAAGLSFDQDFYQTGAYMTNAQCDKIYNWMASLV